MSHRGLTKDVPPFRSVKVGRHRVGMILLNSATGNPAVAALGLGMSLFANIGMIVADC